jgi:hypothetical protein
MPQIKKQISVALISLLFLLSIVPFVNATSETFLVPAGGSHDLTVNLNQGDTVRVKLYVTWDLDSDASSNDYTTLSFEIKDPSGKIIQSHGINHIGVKYTGYSFQHQLQGSTCFISMTTRAFFMVQLLTKP